MGDCGRLYEPGAKSSRYDGAPDELGGALMISRGIEAQADPYPDSLLTP